ncbi:MAG: hypothetical protein PHE88_02200 [Elusimicrobia bacterium]|nr:hypothetical protein [Elusimicrobiota bacterium]
MKEKYIGLLVALITVPITVGIAFLLPKQNVLNFFTILLMGIAGAYFGFAFSGSTSKKDVFIEVSNVVMYIALLLLSIIVTPYFLIAGYFWHGIWDAIHHEKLRIVKTKVPEWYIVSCTFYDWAVGIFLIWWLSV